MPEWVITNQKKKNCQQKMNKSVTAHYLKKKDWEGTKFTYKSIKKQFSSLRLLYFTFKETLNKTFHSLGSLFLEIHSW